MIYTIIGIVLFIFIALLLFKIFKKVVKVIMTLFLLSLVVSAVIGYFVYQDFRELNDNFKNSTNLFLFDVNGEIVNGFRARGFELNEKEKLTQEGLFAIQQNYKDENYQEILGEDYKIIIFRTNVIEESELQGDSFDKITLDFNSYLLFNGLKQGNITIYPEIRFSNVMRFIPSFITNRMKILE